MNVFISWSGDTSKAVAESLRDWLPLVIHSVKPWMSAADLEKGARWMSDIANQLRDTKIGIICLTPDNLEAPWVMFEAGALSKKLDRSRVCPYLFEMEPASLRGPLVQFTAAKAQKDDTKKLIRTINRALRNPDLSDEQVDRVFEMWWPSLDTQLRRIPRARPTKPPQHTDREILEEVLALLRQQVREDLADLTKQAGRGQAVGWPPLFHATERGLKVLKEFLRENLVPLKEHANRELKTILTPLERKGASIETVWRDLISETEALERRLHLLRPQSQEQLQRGLMWLAARGSKEDIEILKYLKTSLSDSSKRTTDLLEIAEQQITSRSD